MTTVFGLNEPIFKVGATLRFAQSDKRKF